MFFLLSKRKSSCVTSGWTLLGVVVADNVDLAIRKIELKETARTNRTEGKFPGIFISLESGSGAEYYLESMEEITSSPE